MSVPLLLTGVSALIFRELSLTISFAILASLPLALTLVPMLAAQLGKVQFKSGLEQNRALLKVLSYSAFAAVTWWVWQDTLQAANMFGISGNEQATWEGDNVDATTVIVTIPLASLRAENARLTKERDNARRQDRPDYGELAKEAR